MAQKWEAVAVDHRQNNQNQHGEQKQKIAKIAAKSGKLHHIDISCRTKQKKQQPNSGALSEVCTKAAEVSGKQLSLPVSMRNTVSYSAELAAPMVKTGIQVSKNTRFNTTRSANRLINSMILELGSNKNRIKILPEWKM